MSGHCLERFAFGQSGRAFKATTLCLLILMGGLSQLVGCGSGEQDKSSAPPSPQGAAAQGAAPQRGAEPDDEDQQEAIAGEPVPDAPFDLSYLDAETELFVFARPAAVASSPFVQALTGGRLGTIDQMMDGMGISIEQIDTVTVGVRNLKRMAEQSQRRFAHLQKRFPGAAMAGMRAPDSAADDTIVVVRTVDPTSAEALGLADPDEESAALSHQSQLYYPLPTGKPPVPYLYLADEKTLVIAAQNTIKQVIEHREQVSQPQVDLSFIPETADIVVALVPKDRDALFNVAHQAGLGSGGSQPGAFGSGAGNSPPRLQFGVGAGEDEEDEDEEDEDDRRGRGRSRALATPSEDLDKLLAAHTEAVALLFDVDADLKIALAVRCDGHSSAVKIAAMLGKAVRSAKESFEDVRESLPGVIQQIADAVMGTIKTGADDRVVTLSMALPESQQANLTVLPMAVMGMMMSGQAMSMGSMEAMVDWQARAQEVIDQGQPPVAAEGLPAGLELRALARWGVASSGGGLSAAPLEVAIVATGELAARTIAFGQQELTDLNVGDGPRLKWLGATPAGQGQNPIHEFVPIDRGEIFPRHPEGGIATGYTFGLTGELSATLPVVTGTFTLKAAENIRDVTVNRVPPSGRADDDVLRALGFTAKAEGGNGFASMVFTYKDSPSIGKIEVLDAQGNPITASSWEKVSLGQQVRQTIHLPGDADPAEFGYRVTVFDEIQEIPVTFRFEDLSLPGPSDDSDEPTAIAMWTPVERPSDAIPEGLIIEAQARWQVPQMGAFGSPFEGTAGNSLTGLGTPPATRGGAGKSSGGVLQGRGIGFGRNEDDDDDDGRESRKAEKRRRRNRRDDDDIPGAGKGNRSQTPASRPTRPKFSDEIDEDDDDFSPSGAALGSRILSANGEGSLQLALDLTGPLAKSVTSLGELTISAAVSAEGDELDFEGSLFLGSDITDDWAVVDTLAVAKGDQPPDGLRVLVLLSPPNPPIDNISHVRGTLHIRTAREQVESVVRNLNDRTKRRIKDRNLGKFGIVIVVAIEESRLMFRVLEGDEDRISEMYPVDRNGERIRGVGHSTALDNGNLVHHFDFPRRVPSKVGLKFSMNLGVQEFDIPLRFRDMRVPVPPRPEVTIPTRPFAPVPARPAAQAPARPAAPAPTQSGDTSRSASRFAN